MKKATLYRHVVWDWNGTLFDDVELCADVMNELLAERRLPLLSVKRYLEIFDFPVMNYYEQLGFDPERDPFEKVGTEFITLYERRKLEAGLYADAITALGTLKEAGVTQSVLSAYRQDMLCELIGHFGLTSFFDALVGLDNHYAAGKMDNGLRWIRGLGVDPSDVLLVGDTLHDYEVAQAMGTDCVLIAGGHQSRERLVACPAPLLNGRSELRERLIV